MRPPALFRCAPRTANALLCAAALIPAAALAADSDSASGTETALAPIRVTGSRIDLREELSPGVVSVAYPDDVKGEHKSIPELLDQIPGVYVRRVSGSGSYTTATIRGSAPSQVNIYIDGVPLNTASETAADLSTLPISNVERVEVYRGTTPARFSGAPIGGAINIVTKKPAGFSGSVSVGARSFGGAQQSANLNVPLLGGNLLIGLDNDRSDGDFKYKNYAVGGLKNLVFGDGVSYLADSGDRTTDIKTGRTIPEERRRMNNKSEKQNVLLKWQDERFVLKFAQTDMERYLPAAVLTASSGIGAQTTDLPWVDTFYRQRRQQRIEQQEGLAGWRDNFGNLGLSLNLTWLDKDQTFRNLDFNPATNYIGERWTDYRTKRYGIAGDATYAFGDGGAFSHLFEIHAERYWETLFSDISGRTPASDFIPEFRRIKTNLQVQDTVTVAALGNLQVTPIGRLEKLEGPVIGSRWSPLAGPAGQYDWEPTGSLSVKKHFTSGWQVFGNYGNYIRYPNFYEIYGNGIGYVPGADSNGRAIQLKPETGRNGDFGFGWDGRLSEKLRGGFRLTYFQREADNAITLYATPLAAKYINSGDTLTQGMELEGKLAWSDRADLQFAVTQQEGRYVNGGWYYNGGTSGAERFPGKTVHTLYTPLLVANARLNLHFLGGRLTTYVEGKHTGRTYTDVTSWENSLTTFDLGAHYKIDKGWRLSAGVIDLFDAGPRQTAGGRVTAVPYNRYGCTPSAPVITGDPGTDCAIMGGTWGSVYSELREVKSNVGYPQQGRTFYATLAYTF